MASWVNQKFGLQANKTTVWTALRDQGFNWKESKEVQVHKEREDVVAAREKFLKQVASVQAEGGEISTYIPYPPEVLDKFVAFRLWITLLRFLHNASEEF